MNNREGENDRPTPHIRFGRTGLQVSRLCLGTMTFGGQCDEARSHAILDAAGSLVNMSMATLAVAWVLSNPAINAPIVGASRPEQLADSLAAAEMDRLPTDLKVSLDELTHGWRLVDADR